MTTTAKLFISGRSQAIRLPAKLRLQAQEVRIEQIGSALWLQPQVRPEADMGNGSRTSTQVPNPCQRTSSLIGRTCHPRNATGAEPVSCAAHWIPIFAATSCAATHWR